MQMRVTFQILFYVAYRFGGSFPTQRVKTVSSFFSTFAISFPVGSLGEEFGWRGVMAPYTNIVLDRKFGRGRSWKWTPLLQSLLTGVIWAVCDCNLQHIGCVPMTFASLFCRCGMCQCFTLMPPAKGSVIFGNF